MRGISAKSLAEVLAAVDAAEGPLDDLGDELFEVVDVLDSSPGLRRVLTDPGIETDAQDGLAKDVFGGKVGADALAVVRTAAGRRWSSGRDLADGLETAGVAAHVAAADKAGELDALESQLFDFGRLVAENAELRDVITDRAIAAAPKAELVGSLLNGKVSVAAVSLAKQAAAARTGSFEKVLSAFAEVAAARRNKVVAEVRVAYQLSDDEKQRLIAALAAKYGSDVHINIIVDPAVLGGISVAVGDQIVDGSVSSRLEDARRRIAG